MESSLFYVKKKLPFEINLGKVLPNCSPPESNENEDSWNCMAWNCITLCLNKTILFFHSTTFI